MSEKTFVVALMRRWAAVDASHIETVKVMPEHFEGMEQYGWLRRHVQAGYNIYKKGSHRYYYWANDTWYQHNGKIPEQVQMHFLLMTD